MIDDRKVQGYCPNCGHDSLFLAHGGYITCSIRECRQPCIASDILADTEIHHIVTLDEHTFTVRHPLRERFEDELLTCSLHDYIASLDGPPRKPGTYRVIAADRWSSAAWIERAIPHPTERQETDGSN